MAQVSSHMKRNGWVWPVAFVTALHLLTTAGTWWITDHGEILAVADHFRSTGQMNLEHLGAGWEDWTRIAQARGTTQTRFLPGAVVSLIPFLAVDHLFGFQDPAHFFFVYLQGHVFVTLGLWIAGASIMRSSQSGPLCTLSILVLGLNWPVWMIARRLGPEPVLFFLMAWFVSGKSSARLIVLILLPWIHATGAFLSLGGLLWMLCARPASTLRSILVAAAVMTLGFVSVSLWNQMLFGHDILGGYARFGAQTPFSIRGPVEAFVAVAPIFIWTFGAWWLVAGTSPARAARALLLWLPMLAFLGFFTHPELLPDPEVVRRLSPLLASTVIAGVGSGSFPSKSTASLMILFSFVSGLFGLSQDFVDTVPTPLGTFSGPLIGLFRLAFVQGHPGLATVVAAALVIVAMAAGSHALKTAFAPDLSPPRAN